MQRRRFSQIYLQPPELVSDSGRARTRVGALFSDFDEPDRLGMRRFLHRELGVCPVGPYSHEFERFLAKAEIRDFLDTITCIYEWLLANNRRVAAAKWLQAVQRIFAEERLRYRVDDDGVVHFAVDENFESTRNSTLAGLVHSRFQGSREAFERAYEHLAEQPPDSKLAIRAIFEAVEIAFRVIFPGAIRIGSEQINQHLRPLLQRRYAASATQTRTQQKLASSLAEWIEAIHPYRHGEGDEDPVQVPLDFAIWAISSGAAHLRWLIQLDQNADSA